MIAPPRHVPLAWRLLAADRPRLVISGSRIAFAVVLMFSQVGFLAGVTESALHLFGALRADLYLASPDRDSWEIDAEIPRARLYQARAVPGVAAALPLYFEAHRSEWKNPQSHQEDAIRVLAFDVEDPLWDRPDVRDQVRRLGAADTALFDRQARDFLGQVAEGSTTELRQRRVRVVGLIDLGTDFRHDGTLLMSDDNFFHYFPERRRDWCAVGVVQLCPGASPARVAERLRQALPGDVRVLTPAEFMAMEERYWARRTMAGLLFGFGVAVGVFIGTLSCFQIVAGTVQDASVPLATLQAMGYSRGQLRLVVVQLAAYLGLLGLLPGIAGGKVVYVLLQAGTGLTMNFTPGRVARLSLLALGMCVLAGLAAARELRKTDPAELLR
jgi:putative ABC transport system permease protein